MKGMFNDETLRVADDHGILLASPMTWVFCGARNQGKSTSARFAVNKLLSQFKRVMFLDADVGQCEFTIAGTVSLVPIDAPLLGNGLYRRL
jgi:polynucleotide 5'-hydroxyl-kinase GRC3/NOL9